VPPLTLAWEWNAKNVHTATGARWRITTVKRIFVSPRVAGLVTYRGEILHSADGVPVRGEWEPILTRDEYAAVCARRSWLRPRAYPWGLSRSPGMEVQDPCLTVPEACCTW
jgi:hypothetical protein